MNLKTNMSDDSKNNIAVLKVILLAASLTGLSFYLQNNIGINLADEGYLLYGVVQTAAGKVPIRDFHAYDPGRYYWMAAWSLIFGEGLRAMRLYLALFGFMGLSLGLLAARRVIKSFWGLIPLGALLTLWMFPRFHSFDLAFAMGTVFFATRLIEAPTLRRYFSAGVFVGVAAFFGRNLGLYAFLAISVTTFYIWLRLDRGLLLRRYASFVGGVFLGYSPMFFMVLFIPGFFSAFVDSILFLFRLGATNLPLPVPWPWQAFSSGAVGLAFRYYFFLGLIFLVMPLFYLFCLVRLPFIRKEEAGRNALLTASLFTGVFYLHYVFSRADIEHLARGISPMILAMAALVCLLKAGWGRKALIIGAVIFLSFASYFTILQVNPAYNKNVRQRGLYLEYPIRGDKIWMHRGQAVVISAIERTVSKYVPPEAGLFLAPTIPAMYYILERESPTWDIYFVFKTPPEEQAKIIASLEEHNVSWAVVGDISIDGRDDLRFSRTYDMVWAYLRRNYVIVAPLRDTGYVLIQKREGYEPLKIF